MRRLQWGTFLLISCVKVAKIGKSWRDTMWNIFGAKISNTLKEKKAKCQPKEDLKSKERQGEFEFKL